MDSYIIPQYHLDYLMTYATHMSLCLVSLVQYLAIIVTVIISGISHPGWPRVSDDWRYPAIVAVRIVVA